MVQNNSTLLDRLNQIVEEVHINEVRQIISTLTRISNLRTSIEEELCTDNLFEKIDNELKSQFDIDNFKISLLENNIECILHQKGDDVDSAYQFSSKVSNSIVVRITIDKNLTDYQTLALNSYFSEIVHILYIQFVLSDLKKSTTTDPLTGLENRISFNQEMKTLIPLAIRENMNIGALLINIDRFRAVNDEHGDQFGDEFLKLYAKTIKDNIRSSDIAVRFGGGEFLVLLINIDTEDRTIQIANKLRERLADTYLLTKNSDHFQKTVCVGVSMFPQDSQDINQVVKNCEMALSDARDEGRNRVLRFQEEDESSIDLF